MALIRVLEGVKVEATAVKPNEMIKPAVIMNFIINSVLMIDDIIKITGRPNIVTIITDMEYVHCPKFKAEHPEATNIKWQLIGKGKTKGDPTHNYTPWPYKNT